MPSQLLSNSGTVTRFSANETGRRKDCQSTSTETQKWPPTSVSTFWSIRNQWFRDSGLRTTPYRGVIVTADQFEVAPIGGGIKRLIDVIFAAGSLAFLLPLFGLIALLIRCSDGGPVFYRHWRIGHARRHFECLKFRTMVTDGDDVLRQHLAASARASHEWTQTRKLKRDPRVTAVGAVLRKFSLDELPQLINILRGDMSIVGPRPIVSEEVEMYGAHAELYFKARPGLTGLWQVSGRNDKSYGERIELDCEYVSGWSLRIDLMIIVRTIPAVLSLHGSY